MSENSTLPIEIVVGLDKSSLGIAFAELEAKAASAGRKIGDSMSKAMSQEKQIDKQLNTDRYFKQAQAIDSVTEAMRKQNEVFKQAKIRSPQDIAAELAALRETKKVWLELGPSTEGYKGQLEAIERRTNILTEGNARARGSFHKMTAALASLTFEITGAIYGLAAIGLAFGAPAIAGIKFLKTIEDAKHGMAANISAMAQSAGMTLSYAQSSAIASQEIDQLSKNSIKYNIALEDVAKTYQAIIGPGLAAGMTLKEVGQIATIGTMAVKSLGMNATQVVQEVRDLVQGGIQAASSTLATSLGLKDKDINDAKKSAEGLFVFLEKRMSGYTLAAIERQNTLSGAWDVLKIKITRLFSDESGFNVFKKVLTDISDAIGVIDYKTGEIKFNQDLVDMATNYWTSLKLIVSVIGTIIEYIGKLLPLIIAVGTAFVSWKIGTILLPALEKGAVGLFNALTKAPSVFDAASSAAGSFAGKLSNLSMGARGGIIGLALFAMYEVADYFGIVDKIFTNVEKRAKQASDYARGLSLMELEAQQAGLRKQLASQVGAEDKVGFFDKGKIVAEREETAAKLVAINKELEKRLEIEKNIEEAQSYMSKGQALKGMRGKSEGLGDQEAALAKYTKRISEIGSLYANVMRGDKATNEERAEGLNIYTRELAAAQKELESFGKSAKSSTPKVSVDIVNAAKDDYAKQSEEINKALNAGTTTFEHAYEKRKAILHGYIKEGVNVKNFQTELSKATLEFYKVEASQIDESVADGVRSYSEGYDAKVALIESFKNKSISAATAEIETNNLRIKLAKDSTAAMKDIDAATAKYADTMSDGARYEKDFLDATKNKVDIMDKELDVLKSLSDPTEEQRKKMEALTGSLARYKVAVTEVTTVIKPMLDAMQKIDQLKSVSDIQIESIKQQPLDLAVGGPQERTPIEQSGIDLTIYENRNNLLREANAELEKMIALGAANADKTSETGKKFEESKSKVLGLRKEVEGYAKAINLSKTYGDQFYNAFNKSAILFGKLGKSIADVAGGVGNLVGISKTYSKSMGDAAKISDDVHDPKRIEVEQKAYKKMSEESIDAYANIAGAAKGMFEENTAGYKVMEAIEKGFRAFQLAASIAAIAQGWTETAASTTQSATKATGSTVAGVAKAFEQMGVWGFVGAAAIIAFMASMGSSSSGSGSMPSIPQEATAEYQQSIQGTGTVLGDSTAQSETIANGIEILSQHSFEMLDYSQGMLSALKRIDGGISNLAASLAKISGITGVGGVSAFGTVESSSSDPGFFGIGASTSSTEIVNTGIYIKGTIDALTNLTGTIEQFETTATSWSDSGFFGFGAESGTDISTQSKAITGEAVTQIGMIFGSMSDSIREGIDLLGMAADSTELEAMMTAIGNVPIDLSASLQGLSGEDITNALNGVFSAAFDNMVAEIMPYASDFQQIGEGVGETFIRLAANARTTELALKSMGMSFPTVEEYSLTNAPTAADLENVVIAQTARDAALAALQAAQAAQAADIPNVSIAFDAEGFLFFEEGLATVSQATIDATNALIKADEALAAAHLAAGDTTMDMSHKLTIAREYLIEGAGGMDAFVESSQFFADNFLSEAERLKPISEALSDAFGDMSVADEATGHLAGLGLQLKNLAYEVPRTREEFTAIIKSLDLTTTAGADLYNSMMAVAPAFDSVLESTLAFTKQLRDDANSFASVMSSYRGSSMIPTHQAELDAAFTTLNKLAPWIRSVEQLSTMTSEDFSTYSEEARTAILETMQAADRLKDDYATAATAASDQATQAANEAAAAYREALNLQQSYLQGLVNFGKSVKDFLDQLEVNPNTAVSPQAQLDAARNQYLSDLSKAKAGDYDAAQNITRTAQTYIDVAKSFYGNGSEQSAILSQIKAELGALNPVAQYDSNLAALKDLDTKLASLSTSTDTVNNSINNIGIMITTAVEVSTETLAAAYASHTNNQAISTFTRGAPSTPSQGEEFTTSPSKYTMPDWLVRRYAMHKVPVPQFADGGDFTGGIRLVGEYGPELEVTGPSRIYNANQTRNLLTTSGNNDSIITELKMLRAELSETKITLARTLERGNSKISEQTQELSNVMHSNSDKIISGNANIALLRETA